MPLINPGWWNKRIYNCNSNFSLASLKPCGGFVSSLPMIFISWLLYQQSVVSKVSGAYLLRNKRSDVGYNMKSLCNLMDEWFTRGSKSDWRGGRGGVRGSPPAIRRWYRPRIRQGSAPESWRPGCSPPPCLKQSADSEPYPRILFKNSFLKVLFWRTRQISAAAHAP